MASFTPRKIFGQDVDSFHEYTRLFSDEQRQVVCMTQPL